MTKRAVSITLDVENVTWLKGRVGATGCRSVSELLDRLVSEARVKKAVGPSTTVVGTIDVDASDPMLLGADRLVRGLVDASIGQSVMVRESSPAYGTRRGKVIK